MTHQEKDFLTNSEKKSFDIKHRFIINNNIAKYERAVEQGLQQFEDYELARSRAAYIKTQALENLDKYLLQFEENFTKRGGKVIWAESKTEAIVEILNILDQNQTRLVVKSKSMTTEEIELNEFFEDNEIEVLETDLGEYIVQLAGQKPYHIVTPAMHLSKKEISDLFAEKLHSNPTDDAQELTATIRQLLRSKFTTAEVGITGANFLIADIGAIAITENEGNARLSTSFPKIHIAIVGIEKIIPNMQDLDLFWALLATSGTGQRLTVYNTVLSGPRQKDEIDGPEEMYVLLLDNGRSKLLADAQKREALNCIRCGACLNVCPVFKNIGGHNYQNVYSGPIGSVITPHLEGMKKFKHLSQASSLCGACESVCPVKIDLPNLLLLNREQSVKERLTSSGERTFFKLWTRTMRKRSRLNSYGARIKYFLFKRIFKNSWGKRRNLPEFPALSFNQLWKKERGY